MSGYDESEEDSIGDDIVNIDDILTDDNELEKLSSVEEIAEPEQAPLAEALAQDDDSDITDPDDIDALLAQAAPTQQAPATEALTSDDDSDITDPDDIDALLAQAAPIQQATATEALTSDDDSDITDPDDIDALLAQAAPTQQAPSVEALTQDDDSDITDPDDIDALLAQAAPDQQTSLAEELAQDGDSEITDPDDIDALLAQAAPDQQTSSAEELAQDGDSEITDPDDIDALLAQAVIKDNVDELSTEKTDGYDEILSDVSDPVDIDDVLNKNNEPATSLTDEITDPDDIDALLAEAVLDEAMREQEQLENSHGAESSTEVLSSENNEPEQAHQEDTLSSVEITDPHDIDALLESMETNPIEAVDIEDTAISSTEDDQNDNRAKIESFSPEYVAPFLEINLRDAIADTTNEEPINQQSEMPKVPAKNTADDFDLDSLIDQVNEETELEHQELDIGDDLLSGTDFEPESSNENKVVEDAFPGLAEQGGGFDESTLSQLLNDEQQSSSVVELSPDFTDQNVLADLLAEDDEHRQEIIEASEMDDIQELDSLDFDELLANIEEESMVSTISATTKIDAVDDINTSVEVTDTVEPAEIDSAKVNPMEDFVSVDSLLSDSFDARQIEEPYNKANIEVGLGEFPEFTEDVNEIDVDEDEQGLAAKLDLAKVYIEIGDLENAEVILCDVVSQGDAQQQFEAQQLLDHIK